MVTVRKKIQTRAVVRAHSYEREILSSAVIAKTETPIVKEFGFPPFDSSEVDNTIFPDLSQQVVIRHLDNKDKQLDPQYGFETAQPKERNTLAIIRPVTERDAKLIESGYAKIGDFKVFFQKGEAISTQDVLFDPLRNITLELVQFSDLSAAKHTLVVKSFIGRVQSMGRR
jgi:hypothetical protein